MIVEEAVNSGGVGVVVVGLLGEVIRLLPFPASSGLPGAGALFLLGLLQPAPLAGEAQCLLLLVLGNPECLSLSLPQCLIILVYNPLVIFDSYAFTSSLPQLFEGSEEVGGVYDNIV